MAGEVICIDDDTDNTLDTVGTIYRGSNCLVKREPKRNRDWLKNHVAIELSSSATTDTSSFGRNIYCRPLYALNDSDKSRNLLVDSRSSMTSSLSTEGIATAPRSKRKRGPSVAPIVDVLQQETSAVQFIKLPSKMYSIELPSWWSQVHGTSSTFRLVELPIESPEAVIVLDSFQLTTFMVKIVSRIESPKLWRRYLSEVHIISEDRGDNYEQNERLLFHCTKASMSVICTQGLDVRLSNQGSFGRGIYFR